LAGAGNRILPAVANARDRFAGSAARDTRLTKATDPTQGFFGRLLEKEISSPVRLLTTLLMLAGAAPAAGSDWLARLKEGDVRHGFTVRAAFTGVSSARIGVRLGHRTGLQLDAFVFPSVPQASVQVRTPPVSDRGEPHTLEHLTVGKGRMGKLLGTLQQMRLVTGSAGTYPDVTMYQIRTPIGRDGFYEMLEHYLETLVRPDFTDEEVRREVANLEVVQAEDGRLSLAERGTVYNEVVAQSRARIWWQLQKMVFREPHPLSFSAGGLPEGLRALGPEEIRRFHAANYRLGAGYEMIVSLPVSWSGDELLERLDNLLARLSADGPAPPPAPLPPPRPGPPGEIRIGSYPAASADAPQEVLLGWPALAALSADEYDALEILMDVVGDGDASYLHRDLIDRDTRSFESGATRVAAGLLDLTAVLPYVNLRGVPASSIEEATLARLREAVVRRFRWIAGLPEGSNDLAGVSAKTRARLAASRRAYLDILDGSPRFGDRSDRRWHDRLTRLAREPGFTKAIAPFELYDRLERELAAGANPWRGLVERAGLAAPPYVSALRPDPALAERERAETSARLAQQEREVADRLGHGDPQKGLAALRAEHDARTAELEARDRTIPTPRFAARPPLTLDDAPFEQARVAGVPLVRVHFDTTAFTHVGLAFDLSAVPDDERALLPLLAPALSETGVTTRTGERLDHVQARERRQSEIYSFSVVLTGNPAPPRYELQLRAAASSSDEIARAAEWMENHLLRPGMAAARARLVDLCKQEIQSYRTALDGPEWNWADGLADAFVYQDNPLHLATSSVFTELRSATRLRWRLEDPSPESRRAFENELAAVEELMAGDADRAAVAARLEAVAGELGETLRYEHSLLPGERWRQDLAELIRGLRADLAAGSAEVLAGLERLRRRIGVRRGARAWVTASPRNAEIAARRLQALLARLPEGVSARPAPQTASTLQARLEQRYGKITRPVHVGFVRPGSTTAVHVVFAPGPAYSARTREAALDALAVGVFAGYGPHTFYKKTWSAGLAYGNGIAARPNQGRIVYYADRCPDPVRVMKFVGGVAAEQRLDDPSLLEYALSSLFRDIRSADDFSSRGAAMARDLADGITPEQVAGFKRLLLATAREEGAAARVAERVRTTVGRVLVGYGPKIKDTPGAVASVIGPEELLAKYEAYLHEQGECDRLVRLYPRDFWPVVPP
jgi:Zn-dependent M16 (insulinase) family peptidase